jgi:hypothetical protein
MTPQPPRSVCRARHCRPGINSLLSCQILQSCLTIVGICVLYGQGCRLDPCVSLRVHRLHDGEFDARRYGRKTVILHQDHCIVGFSLCCVG